MSPQLHVSPQGSLRRARALAWLNDRGPAEPLVVVVPSPFAGTDLFRHYLTAPDPSGHRSSPTPRGFFGWQHLTLAGLARQIGVAALAEQGVAIVTGLTRHALCARAIHRVARQGRLGALEPLAGRPGFPRALARTLDDLAMGGLTAERLEDERTTALAVLWRAYAAELDDRGLADRAAAYAAAVDRLREPEPHPLLRMDVPVLLYDVPVSSHYEAALLDAVVGRATEVMAIVPASDERSLTHHRQALATPAVPLVRKPEPDGSSTSLERLQCHLFEPEAERAPLDDGVTFLSTPGESREAVEIARIALAEAERGVPFDGMAVLLRSPEHYIDGLAEAFERARIPAVFARGTRRPDPAGRAMLALLACAEEGLSASRFAEYLSLGVVPAVDHDAAGEDWVPPRDELALAATDADPEDVSVEGVPTRSVPTPRRWERLLVDAAVIGGRARWERRLDGLVRALDADIETLADDPKRQRARRDEREALVALKAFAMPLIDRLAALPSEATWAEWIDHLDALAVAALRQPQRVRELLGELAPMGPVGPVSLEEVQLVLGRDLAELVVLPPTGRAGKILVASADEARGMVFDVVFVPGLAEKIFPRKVTEDPLALDALRARLSPVLDTNVTRVAAERRALRLAVGAARRRVVLSYPRIDVDRSRPRVPSFYGLEVLRAAEGVLPGFDELARRAERGAAERMGWPAPRAPGDAIDASEFDLAVLDRLLRQAPDESRGAARYLLSTNAHLARSLRFRARRWKTSWTRADGMLRVDESTTTMLAEHRLQAREYSPTALELFARCPYRFYLSAILRLSPRDDIAALEELDPLQRGRLIHEVQMRVMRALKDEQALPVTADRLARALAVLDEQLEAAAERYREELAPAIERVWDDGVEIIRRDLREWLQRSSEEPHWRPRAFELGFGLPGRPDLDPASVDEPVTVAGARLRGSIDLVEERSTGEGVALRATDHKTGRAPDSDVVVIGGGRVLQPLLYALALESLEPRLPIVEGRLYYCTSRGGYAERVVPLDDLGRDRARRVLDEVDRAIDGPFLPAYPEPGGCAHCDYLSVCGPREEQRTARKMKIVEIAAIGRMRDEK